MQWVHFALPQDITYPPDQILPAFRRFRSGSCLNDVAASSFQLTCHLVMATSTTAHACKVYASGQFMSWLIRHRHHLHCACRTNISNMWTCHDRLESRSDFNSPIICLANFLQCFHSSFARSVGMLSYLMAILQKWYHGWVQLWTRYW